MIKNRRNHIFMFDESGRKLQCPECRKFITPPDVEMFYACPYCNAPIAADTDLEDFTIEPLVRHWENRCLNPNSGIIGGR